MLKATKAYTLCNTLPEAQDQQKELAFYTAIKAIIHKDRLSDNKKRQQDNRHLLQQILDNSLISEGIDDIFALCGLDKPNIGLLSEEFLDDIRQMPYQNLAVELLEKLLKDNIHSRTKIILFNSANTKNT